jgi:hypothetical protein
MKLKSILFCALLFINTAKLKAQTPILDSTVCITVGDLAQINVINNALSIPSGNAGVAQTYDYSVLPSFNSNYEILGIDNLTSPFGNTYPSANATVSWSSFGSPYYHFLLSDTSYIYLGGGGSFGDYQYVDTYQQLKFPFTYNDSYTDTFVAISNTGGYRAGTVTVSGDGYGTLLVPGQTFNDVLRVKRVSAYYDTISGNPRFTEETYYEYYKPGIPHYILLHGFYTITSGAGNPVSGAQLFFNSAALVTNVKANSNTIANYFIAQNGPQWYLQTQDKAAFISPLSIYNLQGQLVMQEELIVSKESSSQSLPTAELAHGMYLVQFKNTAGELVSLKWCKAE